MRLKIWQTLRIAKGAAFGLRTADCEPRISD